jgi:hypothetical protein
MSMDVTVDGSASVPELVKAFRSLAVVVFPVTVLAVL